MNSDDKGQAPVIQCAPNGPYLVKNLGQFRDSEGNSISTKPVIALCRCGKSSNKPFCDGTHSKIGFSGEKEGDGSEDKRDNFVGKGITIHDNRGICAHAGFCTDNLASVFRMKQEPWIDPDGAEAEIIIETIRKCPSGALSYSIEGVEQGDPDRGPMVTVTKDGPYHVIGGVELTDVPSAEGVSGEQSTLCRCGASKNKPFCDGSHWSIEFKDDE